MFKKTSPGPHIISIIAITHIIFAMINTYFMQVKKKKNWCPMMNIGVCIKMITSMHHNVDIMPFSQEFNMQNQFRGKTIFKHQLRKASVYETKGLISWSNFNNNLIPMCVSTVGTYPSSVKKKSQACYWVGIRTHNLCNSIQLPTCWTACSRSPSETSFCLRCPVLLAHSTTPHGPMATGAGG